MCTVDPAILEEFRSVRATCRIPCDDLILSFALGCSASSSESNSLVTTVGYSPEYDVSGITDPFLQHLAVAPPAWEGR